MLGIDDSFIVLKILKKYSSLDKKILLIINCWKMNYTSGTKEWM